MVRERQRLIVESVGELDQQIHCIDFAILKNETVCLFAGSNRPAHLIAFNLYSPVAIGDLFNIATDWLACFRHETIIPRTNLHLIHCFECRGRHPNAFFNQNFPNLNNFKLNYSSLGCKIFVGARTLVVVVLILDISISPTNCNINC